PHSSSGSMPDRNSAQPIASPSLTMYRPLLSGLQLTGVQSETGRRAITAGRPVLMTAGLHMRATCVSPSRRGSLLLSFVMSRAENFAASRFVLGLRLEAGQSPGQDAGVCYGVLLCLDNATEFKGEAIGVGKGNQRINVL